MSRKAEMEWDGGREGGREVRWKGGRVDGMDGWMEMRDGIDGWK